MTTATTATRASNAPPYQILAMFSDPHGSVEVYRAVRLVRQLA